MPCTYTAVDGLALTRPATPQCCCAHPKVKPAGGQGRTVIRYLLRAGAALAALAVTPGGRDRRDRGGKTLSLARREEGGKT
jgi:hypothetical protein